MHTFAVPADAKELAEGFMVVSGADVNIIDDQYHCIRDAAATEDGILEAAEKMGSPERRYVKPSGGAKFTRR